MKARLLLLSLLLGLSLQGAAMAWETGVNDAEDWLSIYVDMDATPREGAWDQFHDNEHAEHSYIALRNLVQGSSPVIDGVFPPPYRRETYFVHDLNASLFRPGLKDQYTPVGGKSGDRKKILAERAYSSREKPFETRLVPPPHMFSGIPDFSYGIYDWINKNQICPSLPERHADLDLCHAFKGWMGAMNSNHFGTQTWLMYRHIHQLALSLAESAEAMRKKLEKNPEDLEAHKLYVYEAELMALAFEGYGQHFLQDRWSTGHMWERWNSSSYNRMKKKELQEGLVVSAVTGLLHGSQSITGRPDPMCSPAVVPYRFPGEVRSQSMDLSFPGGRMMALPMFWRHCPDKNCPPVPDGEPVPKFPGVGDHRLLDMYDGGFGKEFSEKKTPEVRASGMEISEWSGPDYPIEVSLQKLEMTNCAMAGWAEVIRKFGVRKEGGGYGITGIRIKGGLENTTLENLGHSCSDMWVTNESMALGWGGFDKALTFGGGTLATHESFINTLPTISRVTTSLPYELARRLHRVDIRRDLVRLTFTILKDSWWDPDGIKLAANGLGDFRGIAPGDRNVPPGGVPEYTEPVRLETLKDRDAATGKDLESIFGFFNRAGAEYWCTKIGSGYLDDLRGTDNIVKRGACIYLADRVYGGTDPSYRGAQKEIRTVSGKREENAAPVTPLCDALGLRISADDRLPRRLHPGYVGTPYARDKSDLSFQSVANWCDNAPLLDLLNEPDLMNADVVAVVRDPKQDIRVAGRYLGREEGLLQSEGAALGHMTIVNWTDSGFVFRLPEDRDLPGGDYRIAAVRADGTRTPGRYILRVERKPEEKKPPEKPVTAVKVPETKPPVVSKKGDCGAQREMFYKRCKQMADAQLAKNCAPGRIYSGCALDVAGCLNHYINDALLDSFCDKPGYVGCATGVLEGYLGCLQACNNAFSSGSINTFQILPCRLDCQKEADAGTKACKEGRIPAPPRHPSAPPSSESPETSGTPDGGGVPGPQPAADSTGKPQPSSPTDARETEPQVAPGTKSPAVTRARPPVFPPAKPPAAPPPPVPGTVPPPPPPVKPGWKIVNPNPNNYVGVTPQGRLRMAASPKGGGSDFAPGPNNNAPRALQAVSGDWTLETRFRFAPTAPFQGAGILLCFDENPASANCWRVIERQFWGKGQIINFSGDQKVFTGTTTFLRLTKRGKSYIAWFSADGINWTEAGRREERRTPLFAGVMTSRQPYDGNMNLESVAEFDYVKIRQE
ncbi:MAG: hypothetical protein M0Z38_09920 [Deltaproteobacteria bacterium]|nr:hypothetical protein [Deltaproteobacteria bacterium]